MKTYETRFRLAVAIALSALLTLGLAGAYSVSPLLAENSAPPGSTAVVKELRPSPDTPRETAPSAERAAVSDQVASAAAARAQFTSGEIAMMMSLLLEKLSVADLTERASSILVGTVAGMEPQWSADGSQIYTHVTIVPDDALGGFIKGQTRDEITLVQLGGRIGDAELIVQQAPEFTVGEKVLVFVKDSAAGPNVVGWFQGKFPLRDGMIAGSNVSLEDFLGRISYIMEYGEEPERTARGDLTSESIAPPHTLASTEPAQAQTGPVGEPDGAVEADLIPGDKGGGDRDHPPRAQVYYWNVYPSSGDTSTTFEYHLGNDTYDASIMCGQVSIDGGGWIDMPYYGWDSGNACYRWDYYTTLPAGSHTYQYRFEYYGCGGGNIWWISDVFTGPDVSGAETCCIASTQYGSATAPTDNVEILITSCNYAGEYAIVYSVVSGHTYQFRSGTTSDWLSLTNTSNTCLTYGTTPITWVATFSGDVRLHIHTDSSCGTESSCRYTYVQCTSCPGANPVITSISPTSGGAGEHGFATPPSTVTSYFTINGSNFGSSQGANDHVYFFYYPGYVIRWDEWINSWSNTQITGWVPPGASSNATSGVYVYKDGVWSNSQPFEVTYSIWTYTGVSPALALYWDSGNIPVQYYYNPTNQEGGTTEQIASEIMSAHYTWEHVQQCYVQAEYLGTTSNAASVHDDSQQTVGWSSAGTDWIGATTVSFNTGTGQLVEMDLELNYDYNWSIGAASGCFDIQSICAHEFGHGLASQGDQYGDPDIPETMYGYASENDTGKRTLEPEDEAGAQWAYPYTEHAYACGTYDWYISAGDTYSTHGPLSIDASGDRWYEIYLTSYTQYRFTFCEGGGYFSGDPVLELWNAACDTQVGYNDDYCGLGSQIDYVPTTTDYYYLKVRPCGHSSPLTYKLAYRYIPGACSTPPAYDYSIAPTASYQTHSDYIYRGGCRLYAVSMAAGKPYRFTFCEGGGTADYDTYLILRDSGGSQVAYNDDSCGLQSQLNYDCSSSGTYYLEVNSCCTGSYGGTYTLAYRCGECLVDGNCGDSDPCTDDLCLGSGIDRYCDYVPNNPATPTNAAANPSTVCPGDDTNLTASVSGAEIDWYTGSCGDSYVDTGNSIWVTPPSGTTTTYYALARHTSTGCLSAGCDSVAVTALDSTPPSVTCKDITVYLDGSGNASISPADVYQSGSDNCGTVNLVSVSPNSFDCGDIGGNAVTLTVNDGNGNENTCGATVTVVDNIAPSVTCKNHTAYLDGSGHVSISPSDVYQSGSDNCGTVNLVSVSPNTFDCGDIGGNAVTLTVNDGNGNEDTCGATVTVEDNLAPSVSNCPAAFDVNADAGYCDAQITWVAPTVTDNCTASPTVEYDIDLNDDSSIDATTMGTTYTFPSGTHRVIVRATDESSNVNTACNFAVAVSDKNELVVDVELLDVTAALLSRCVTFELFDCGPDTSQVVTEDVTFGGGTASGAIVLVPCGVYDCITARDDLHTLRRTDDSAGSFVISGTQYTVGFTGGVGDESLIGGNLNDDDFIDIMDFVLYVNRWATNYGSGDTPCSYTPPGGYHADINGTGLVDSGDFTFIQTYFLYERDANCCGLPGMMGDGDAPRAEITIEELVQLGLGHMACADLNSDGVVDQFDIVAFLDGARPSPPPAYPEELEPVGPSP